MEVWSWFLCKNNFIQNNSNNDVSVTNLTCSLSTIHMQNMAHCNLLCIVKGRFSLAPGVKVIMPECLAVSLGGGPCFLQGCIIPTIILSHKGLTLPCYSIAGTGIAGYTPLICNNFIQLSIEHPTWFSNNAYSRWIQLSQLNSTKNTMYCSKVAE